MQGRKPHDGLEQSPKFQESLPIKVHHIRPYECARAAL